MVDRDSLPENAILVARTMGPAALLDYPRARLRGLALEHGGEGSHVAVIARALGIPAVGDLSNVSDLVEPGDLRLWVGSSCADRETEATVTLTGPVHEVAADRATERVTRTTLHP